MVKYYPIKTPVPFDSLQSDLLRYDHREGFADFVMPEEADRVLRVYFRSRTLVRVLDELALSGESEPSEVEGLVAHHFAYRVEGSPFEASQDNVWKELERPISHYRFVTGSACLDVLTNCEPEFGVVPAG